MNHISLVASKQEQTMTSRQIAELVESRHADVCRTIERLMTDNAISGYAPTAYTHPQNGQRYQEYCIGKRDSYVIVAQLSPPIHCAPGRSLARAGSRNSRISLLRYSADIC